MVQREKRYVAVDVRFSEDGRLRPLQIIFDKGQVYQIDKIKDVSRRAADVGGVGGPLHLYDSGQRARIVV